MSLWAATVITSLVTSVPFIGTDIVEWLWGGYAVGNPTLNRFFSFHYIMPFILVGLVIVHIMLLHDPGSNNPIGVDGNVDKIPFHPYSTIKDVFGLVLLMMGLGWFIFFEPNLMGHPDNYIPANPLVTPAHIQPEWYFLFVYTILRSIPDKLLGVIAMLCAILVLLLLPFLHTCNIRSHEFRPLAKMLYWFFIGNFLILTFIGAQAPEEPWVTIGQTASVFYFLYFIFFTPLIGYMENKLLKLNI